VERSRGQILVWLAAAVLATLAVVRLLDGAGGSATSASAPVRLDRSVSGRSGDGEQAVRAGGEAYVHVAGRVRRPGLYRLPVSARVALAVERAGGPAPGADLSAVNLAARVEDGQQIVLPRAGAAAVAGGAKPGAAGAKLSLAQASQEQLEELDGIGPTLAKRILEYRDANGGFRSLDDLKQVDGIGEKRFESLREAVSP
jgi:competence protein ComEA